MPLVKKKFTQNKLAIIGLWEISETKSALIKNLTNDPFLDNEYELVTHEQKKIEFLASRTLLRTICQELSLPTVGLSKDFHGKPYLNDKSSHISLSHSQTRCAAMVSELLNVGIDLQYIDPKLQLVAEKFLSNREVELLQNDLELLCIAWSCKEAVYKQIGIKGLSLKNHFHLSEKPSNGSVVLRVFTSEEDAKLCRVDYEKIDNYILAFCTD